MPPPSPNVFRYAQPRTRIHRVPIVAGVPRPDAHCRIDLGTVRLLDVPPAGERCHYCWPHGANALADEAARRSALRRDRTMAAIAASLIALALMSGIGFGVVGSPDEASPGPSFAIESSSPTPELSPGFCSGLASCLEIERWIQSLIDEAILRHEGSAHQSSAPTPTGSASDGPSPTSRSSSPTARPTTRPRATARPVPTVAPSPSPCFKPGNDSKKDPCRWPPDGVISAPRTNGAS